MDIKQCVPYYDRDGKILMSVAEIFYAVINKIHFERRIARNVGWRGILPCLGFEFTWTCRVLESDCIFGIVYCHDFLKEENLYQKNNFSHNFIEKDDKNNWGLFSLFIFPPQKSIILDDFSLHALYLSEQNNYLEKIRNLSFSLQELSQFYVGNLYLGISENNLCLRLETKEKLQILSINGIFYKKNNKYIIEPMGVDANIPAYVLLRPLFDCIVRTFARVFHCNQEEIKCCIEKIKYKVPAYDDIGNLIQTDQEQIAVARTVQWGEGIWKTLTEEVNDFFSLETSREIALNRPFIHIVSGFLGSGKTTFLREWLAYLQNKDIYLGVIQNEFGQIGLDSFLLQGDTVVEALDEGCVCCSLSDTLRPGIGRILEKMPTMDILLETSGVANPFNVIEEVKKLDDIVQLGLIIVLVDAFGLKDINNVDGVLCSQIESADILVVNKIDLLPKGKEKEVYKFLNKINNTAFIVKSQFGRIHFALLDSIFDKIYFENKKNDNKINPFSLYKKTYTHYEEGFESRILFLKSLSEKTIYEILVASRAVRAKGIVLLNEKGRCLVQFSSQRVEIFCIDDEFLSVPNHIVFIGNKLDNAYLDKIEKLKK